MIKKYFPVILGPLFSLFLFAAELPSSINHVSDINDVGEYEYPSDPMLDRAKGYLLSGKAKTAVENHGEFTSWNNHPSGLWGEFTYIPSFAFMAGVRGHRYSSEFSWQEADMNSICSSNQSGWCQEYGGDINVWCSEELYDDWNLDTALLINNDQLAEETAPITGTNVHKRVNGKYIGIVFETEDDRGLVGDRKKDTDDGPAILNIDAHNQWVFDYSESQSGDSRVCIAVRDDGISVNPNQSDAMIGIMYPWGLRPDLEERLEEFDLYSYGPDGDDWTEDDNYSYYGATVSESWFTSTDSNKDWHPTTKSRYDTHNGETTAGDIFGDEIFIDDNDLSPLLAHSFYTDTWPQTLYYDSFWPGWWAEAFDETLDGCDGNPNNESCYHVVEGMFTASTDVYMRFDDRWAHRGNIVNDDGEYEQTGYPMGIEVSSQLYSYSVEDYEDIIIVDAVISNQSHDMIMPDGTKLVSGEGFDYRDMSFGFYLDADVLSSDVYGSFSVHTNSDDYMRYIDCMVSTEFYPDGCPIINGEALKVSMAVIGDWDGYSGPASGFAMEPGVESPGDDFGLVAVQMLDTPIATEEIDLDGDGMTDIYPGEKLRMTNLHWFDWYVRPGVVSEESGSNCCAGFPGRDQARNKEEMMYKIMVGDTTNLSEAEAEWYFHGDNPHFDDFDAITNTDHFNDDDEGLDCLLMMSTGPFSISTGESVPLSFAVIYGADYDDLLHNAEMAQILYNNHFVTHENNLSNSDTDLGLPTEFHLNDPYPNPFNPKVNISYNVSILTELNFIIYNVNGEVIENIHRQIDRVGKQSFDWDGSSYSSGIYFIKMVADGYPSRVKKITLIK